MAPQVTAAWIAAGAVLVSALFSTFIALWVRAQQRRTEDSLKETQQSIAQMQRETQESIAQLQRDTQLAISATSRETELVVTALGHLVGGTQERAAGIAALRALKALADTRWPDYGSVVGQVLYTQLVFVLTRGRNRWEGHEVVNLETMSKWLASDGTLALDDNMRVGVQ